MKSYRGLILIIIGVLSVPLYYHFEPSIHNIINGYKSNRAFKSHHIHSHDGDEMISSMAMINDEPDAWYAKYRLIAHGCGGIDGKMITNSLEALDYNYSIGTRLFDVDVCWSADSVLVCRHSWKDNTGQDVKEPIWKSKRVYNEKIQQEGWLSNSNTVLNSRVYANHLLYGRYHTLSVNELFLWLETHPDAYCLPDLKGPDMAKAFVRLIQNENKDSILHRIIIRIDDFPDYEAVRKLPYEHFMLKKNNMGINTYSDIINFCVSNDIHAVSLSLIDSDDSILSLFARKGIHVYVAVIDNLPDYFYFINKGAWGAVSNFIGENHLPNNK